MQNSQRRSSIRWAKPLVWQSVLIAVLAIGAVTAGIFPVARAHGTLQARQQHMSFAAYETTDGKPGMTSYQGYNYIAWEGTDANSSLNIFKLDTNGIGNKYTFRSNNMMGGTGPALAIFNGLVYVAYVGKDAQIYVGYFNPADTTLQGLVPIGAQSYYPPAMAVVLNTLYVVWKGADNPPHLNVLSSTNAINWGHKVTFSDTAIAGPGASAGPNYCPTCCGCGAYLDIAWGGTDPDNHLNAAKFFTLNGNTQLTNKHTLSDRSRNSVGLAYGGYGFYMGFVGTDDKVNYVHSDDLLTWDPSLRVYCNGFPCTLDCCGAQVAYFVSGHVFEAFADAGNNYALNWWEIA